MFSFFHRTTSINLDCFTYSNDIYTNTPIIKSSKALPDWWKKIPKTTPNLNYDVDEYENPNRFNNMRHCYGFVELYKKGIIIEHWCDLDIRSNENDYQYYYSNGLKPSIHPTEQRGTGFKNYHHIKLNSPWIFREKTGIQFLFTGAEWNLENYDFVICPGVIRYDIISATNINIVFQKKNQSYFIPMGQPLVQVIPLNDKNLTIKNHLVTEPEWKKMTMTSTTSWKGWRQAFYLTERNKKREEEEDKPKCPFIYKKD